MSCKHEFQHLPRKTKDQNALSAGKKPVTGTPKETLLSTSTEGKPREGVPKAQEKRHLDYHPKILVSKVTGQRYIYIQVTLNTYFGACEGQSRN